MNIYVCAGCGNLIRSDTTGFPWAASEQILSGDGSEPMMLYYCSSDCLMKKQASRSIEAWRYWYENGQRGVAPQVAPFPTVQVTPFTINIEQDQERNEKLKALKKRMDDLIAEASAISTEIAKMNPLLFIDNKKAP